MENKLSNIWKCFLPSVCIFVLQMAISFVGMFFVFCYKAHTYTSGVFGLLSGLLQRGDINGL